MFCTLLIVLLAIRIRQFVKARLINPSRVLATCAYVTVIVFLVILSMLSSGVGFDDHRVCSSLINVCLAFYGLVKVTLYFFMAERVHTVRSVELTRRQDKLWLATILIISGGLSGMVVVANRNSNHELSPSGFCKVGVPATTTIGMILFDLVVNFWLIGLFIYFLRPTMKLQAQFSAAAGHQPTLTQRMFNITLARGDHEFGTGNLHMGSIMHTPENEPTEFISASDLLDASENGGDKLSTASTTHELESSNRVPAAPPLPLRLPRCEGRDADLNVFDMLDDDEATFGNAVSNDTSRQASFGIKHDAAQQLPPKHSQLNRLVKRNLLGTIILFAPIIINVSTFWIEKGYEPAWLCASICSFDVFGSVAVLHWLTSTAGETD